MEEVEAGRADDVALRLPGSTPVPLEVAQRLAARYGPGSEAARAGHQQLFTQTFPAVNSFVFNTQRGPFADPRLRRAVNYAIDRPALSEDVGFGNTGRPTDQYIPPGFPGFDDVAIYPLGGPDLATARRLAGGRAPQRRPLHVRLPRLHPRCRDPGLWRRMAAAARLTGDARLRAYARLDRDLAEHAAPEAAFASDTLTHFFSARMGCQLLHPVYGLDLATLSVRDEAEEE